MAVHAARDPLRRVCNKCPYRSGCQSKTESLQSNKANCEISLGKHKAPVACTVMRTGRLKRWLHTTRVDGGWAVLKAKKLREKTPPQIVGWAPKIRTADPNALEASTRPRSTTSCLQRSALRYIALKNLPLVADDPSTTLGRRRTIFSVALPIHLCSSSRWHCRACWRWQRSVKMYRNC